MWDLESCSTTLNIITTLHEYSILSDTTQPEPVLYTSILPSCMKLIYPEPVLDIWNYNMAYNLSGHSEPCDPHTIFSTLHITFLGTLDQGDPSSFETWDLGIVPNTSGYSEPGSSVKTTSGHCATTNCEPIPTTVYKLNQYLLQPTYDMLTNYIWNSAYNYNWTSEILQLHYESIQHLEHLLQLYNIYIWFQHGTLNWIGHLW